MKKYILASVQFKVYDAKQSTYFCLTFAIKNILIVLNKFTTQHLTFIVEKLSFFLYLAF